VCVWGGGRTVEWDAQTRDVKTFGELNVSRSRARSPPKQTRLPHFVWDVFALPTLCEHCGTICHARL